MGYEPLAGDDAAKWRSLLERFADKSEADQKLVELLYIAKTEPEGSNERNRAVSEIFDILYKGGGLYFHFGKPKPKEEIGSRSLAFFKELTKEIHKFDPAWTDKHGNYIGRNIYQKLCFWLNYICSRRYQPPENENKASKGSYPLSLDDLDHKLDHLANPTPDPMGEIISAEQSLSRFYQRCLNGDLKETLENQFYQPRGSKQKISYLEILTDLRDYFVQYQESNDRVLFASLVKLATERNLPIEGLKSHFIRHFRPFMAKLYRSDL